MKEQRLQDFRKHPQDPSNPAHNSCSESEPFALQVIDDSMEPEFAKGCLIIIDQNAQIRDGRYVLAKPINNELIFRRLRLDNNQYTLEALNPEYPTLRLENLNAIQGVIIQRSGKRRSYHKYYD